MNTYVLVSFWINVVGLSIRLVELAVIEKWPRERRPESLGQQLLVVILGGAMFFWAGYLLWWGPR